MPSRRGVSVAAAAALAAAALATAAFALAWQAVRARGREVLPRERGFHIEGLACRRAAGPPVRLAVAGDSTVAGVGVADARATLPVMLGERVAERIGRPVHVDAFEMTGALTRDVTAGQLDEVAACDPDVLMAVCGSNDVIHATPPWRLWRDVRELSDAVADLGVPLVLAGIPLFQGATIVGRPLRDVLGGYAWLLRRVQRRAVQGRACVLVDIAAHASPRFAGVPEAMSIDGFHPAEVGYGFWADALAPAVVDVLDGDAVQRGR